MRRFGGDLQDIEVKEAVGGMPKSMGDSVSALANGSGGLVILGLSEKLGFMPAPGFRARPIYDALSELCADRLVPPVRAHIDVMEFEGAEVVVGRSQSSPRRTSPAMLRQRACMPGHLSVWAMAIGCSPGMRSIACRKSALSPNTTLGSSRGLVWKTWTSSSSAVCLLGNERYTHAYLPGSRTGRPCLH